MTTSDIRAFLERNARRVVSSLIFVVILLWGASSVIPGLREWVLKNSFFNVVVLVLIAEMLVRVIQLSRLDSKALRVFRDEPHAAPATRDFIETCEPDRADLIEYSTATIHDLLESLKATNCWMRILICHPAAAISDFQRNRILDRIRDLKALTFRDYESVEIRAYRLPAAIRGRLIDNDYVTVGWHTYTGDDRGLVGHTNPMISATGAGEDGRFLRAMFIGAFETLWDADSTEILLQPGGRWTDETSRLVAMRPALQEPSTSPAGRVSDL